MRKRIPKFSNRMFLWPLAFLALAVLVGAFSKTKGQKTPEFVPELPITKVVLPNGTDIYAELALTPEETQKGLMFRTVLPKDRGMLFAFVQERNQTFWMKNTYIDLDIIFIGSDKRIVRVFSDVPRSYRDTPTSDVATVSARAQYVLELAAGVAKENDLKEGDSLHFDLS
jgi:uncharacterized protein